MRGLAVLPKTLPTRLLSAAPDAVVDATVASVALAGGAIAVTDGGSVARTARAFNAAGQRLTGKVFTAVSSDEAVATVAVVGSTVTVTGVAVGSCTITVTCETIDSAAVGVDVSASGEVDAAVGTRFSGDRFLGGRFFGGRFFGKAAA